MAVFRRTKSDLSLIKEGKAVLELLVEKDPSALDALEAYIASFSDWQATWKERVAAAPEPKKSLKP